MYKDMLEIQNMHNMHKYAKCIFFSKLLKTLFLGGSYDSEQLWDFSFLPWKKVLENNKIFTPINMRNLLIEVLHIDYWSYYKFKVGQN